MTTTIKSETKIDVINVLADISDGSPLAALRAQRPDAALYTQGSDHALFAPADMGGVSLIERELVGLRVGTLTKNTSVVTRHLKRLDELQADADTVAAVAAIAPIAASPRLVAILRFTDTLTAAPRLATPEDIAQLRAAGVTDPEIVTIAQLISYLNYQVRLLAGLRAFGGVQ